MTTEWRHAESRRGHTSQQPTLDVMELTVDFKTRGGTIRAVDGVSFHVNHGEVLAIVGESGSGKSAMVNGLLGLLPKESALVISKGILFAGCDLSDMSRRQLYKIRGNQIAMVFQNPLNALNPLMSVGAQLDEAIRRHQPDLQENEVRAKSLEMLRSVEISDPETRYRQYPHEFSGGMRQRVMIGMALANEPSIIIADEPTTALDLTVQTQILRLIKDVQAQRSLSIVLVTHDLGVVAQVADRVVVMYSGRLVEVAPVAAIFDSPAHPYTEALLKSRPSLMHPERLPTPIPGKPPLRASSQPGCPFAPRCIHRRERELCENETPSLRLISDAQHSACHFAEELVHSPDVSRS